MATVGGPPVILCDRDDAFLERVSGALARRGEYPIAAEHTLGEARELAVQRGAAVLVLGPGIPLDAALDVGEALATARPAIAVVLVAEDPSTETLRSAMRAGLRDVVSADEQHDDEIASAVHEAYEATVAARLGADEAGESPSTGPSAKVVTVFSTKGGVGKSVLATNLAVALASDPERTVVLIDLDLESGDDGIMLNLAPAHTICDAVQAIERLDTEMLRGLLVSHSSGAKVLLAPVQPEDAEMITSAKVGRIIDLVRQIADVVIIDTPGALDEVVLTAIDKSDVVLAVAMMDMPSVKNMRVSLQKLAQLGYRDGLVKLVLNRADSKVLMEVSDVEEALATIVAARIPSDRQVPRSVNKGVPIVLEAPRSGVARSLVALASQVVGGQEAS